MSIKQKIEELKDNEQIDIVEYTFLKKIVELQDSKEVVVRKMNIPYYEEFAYFCCPTCNSDVHYKDSFCWKCGRRLKWSKKTAENFKPEMER